MPITKWKCRKAVLRVSPFSTLPLEILAHIFALISSVVPNIRPLDLLPYPAWLPITYVCHYWCTVALSHAQLWTSITPGLSIPWIEVFIEQSQMMVMDLEFLIHPTAWSHAENCLFCGDIIQLLEGFTWICSLYLTGNSIVIAPIINPSAARYPFRAFPYALREVQGNWLSRMICLGERHQFTTYSSLQNVAATSSHLAVSFAMSPISQPKCHSHTLHFSTNSIWCLHLHILNIGSLLSCSGAIYICQQTPFLPHQFKCHNLWTLNMLESACVSFAWQSARSIG